VAVCPSSTAAEGIGGGGAPDASTTATTAGSSSARAGNGSMLRGWGQGSECTTRALNAKRFKGARLSTPVSAYL
jgi:hypothetical protein